MPRTNRPSTAPFGVGLGQIGRGVAGGIITIPGATPGPDLPPGAPVLTADEVVRGLPLPRELSARLVKLLERAPQASPALLRKMLARPDLEPLLAREVMLRALRFVRSRPAPPVRPALLRHRAARAFLASTGGMHG